MKGKGKRGRGRGKEEKRIERKWLNSRNRIKLSRIRIIGKPVRDE